jgi:hypothetical protein
MEDIIVAGFFNLSKRIAVGCFMAMGVFFAVMIGFHSARANGTGGDGPGGVDSTDGTSHLTLWLKTDAGVYANDTCTVLAGDGSPVACWADQSGYGSHFTQSTTGNQPTFMLSGLNNLPILQFDGNSQFLEKSYTANLNELNFTAYIVARTTGGDGTFRSPYASHCSASGYMFYAANSDYWNFWIWKGTQWSKQIGPDADISSWHMIVGYYDNDLTTCPSFDIDGINVDYDYPINFTQNTSCPTRIGAGETQQTSPGAYFPGDIAEIIIFNKTLSLAERTLVNNYLSAKYNIDVNSDKFAGSDPYIHDVAGIGKDDGSNSQGASSGMIVTDRNFLQENGDYILIGHNGSMNDTTSDDVPSGGDWTGAGRRWTRDWYLTLTDKDGTGGAIDITFDISDSGMSGAFNGSATNYRLLKRAGASGTFSDIATANSINDDQVTFENVDVSLLGSYFTLGTVDNASSPTAVIMDNFIARRRWINPMAILILLAAITATILYKKYTPHHQQHTG